MVMATQRSVSIEPADDLTGCERSGWLPDGL